MFRGGSYVDKAEFNGQLGRSNKNTLDISDINGSQPKRRFDSRSSQKTFGGNGAAIIDNSKMTPAGNRVNPNVGQRDI